MAWAVGHGSDSVSTVLVSTLFMDSGQHPAAVGHAAHGGAAVDHFAHLENVEPAEGDSEAVGERARLEPGRRDAQQKRGLGREREEHQRERETETETERQRDREG